MRFFYLFILFIHLSTSAAVSEVSVNTAQYVVDRYEESAIQSLAEVIAIKTVADPNVPFEQHPEMNRFRQWLRLQANNMNLSFSDHGHVLLVSIGQGEKVLGLITHGDVQPANENKWQKSPFTLDTTSEPNKLIGRGVEDDKGPIIAALYAMKGIQDKSVALKGKIELMVYMAEESDWEPLREFLKTYQPAPMNIALDSDYPVVTAEKAWSSIEVEFPSVANSKSGSIIHSFRGGAFRSQIPEEAVAEISGIDPSQLVFVKQSLEKLPVSHEVTSIGNHHIISVKGKAAHSSTPTEGINAINALASVLGLLEWQDSAAAHAVYFIKDLVNNSVNGEYFGNIAYAHDFMGPMTLSPTLTHSKDNQQHVFINIRRPLGKTAGQLKQEINSAIEDWQKKRQVNLPAAKISIGEPLLVDNAPHVPTLLQVFEHFTGIKNPQPKSIGGSTNAKLFPQAVSFGPSMPNTPYTGHSEHEFMTRDQFRLTLKMYTAMMIEIGSK